MTRQITIAVTALMLALGVGNHASAAGTGPIAALKRANDQINGLLRKQAKQSSAKAKKTEVALKKAVNAFLDFRELARRSLAKHWEKRTPAEQEEFVGILRELIERNYLKQLRSRIDYKIDYQNEKITDGTALVNTSVRIKRKGRAEEIEINYKMKRVDGAWMVYDVITDDVSIVQNYRSQFNRIIKRDSYQKLVDKMKRKIEQI